MAEGSVGSVWRSRLRWRRRGAWLWPAFLVLTVADAFLLGPLPISGRHTGFFPGLLLGMFFNLVAVALVAPFASMALRRRRADLPKVVADDRAGTALVVLVTGGLLAGGLAHRPVRLSEDRAFREQSDAVRAYVARNATAEYRAHIDEADTWRQADDLYRTCVPGDHGHLPLCLLVNTDQSPPGVRVDHDRTPNLRR
jgi:hypothetical protein